MRHQRDILVAHRKLSESANMPELPVLKQVVVGLNALEPDAGSFES